MGQPLLLKATSLNLDPLLRGAELQFLLLSLISMTGSPIGQPGDYVRGSPAFLEASSWVSLPLNFQEAEFSLSVVKYFCILHLSFVPKWI